MYGLCRFSMTIHFSLFCYNIYLCVSDMVSPQNIGSYLNLRVYSIYQISSRCFGFYYSIKFGYQSLVFLLKFGVK